MSHDKNTSQRIFYSLVALLLGVSLGAFFYLTYESRALSYLSNDSRACANCHVMLSAYNTWNASSHRKVAQCNDCHIPQDNFVNKYLAKASDGARHTYVFTTSSYKQVLKANPSAVKTIQNNCMRCHNRFVDASGHKGVELSDEVNCWSCHRHVPHGKGNSISSALGIPGESGQIRTYHSP